MMEMNAQYWIGSYQFINDVPFVREAKTVLEEDGWTSEQIRNEIRAVTTHLLHAGWDGKGMLE